MKFPKYKEEMDKLLKDDINNIICTITESPDCKTLSFPLPPSSNPSNFNLFPQLKL